MVIIMAGMKDVTFEEMKSIKFNVISRLGITKQRRNRELFIMDVIPPTKFGADCKGYTWYQVLLITDEDYKQAKDFIEELFQIQCSELNKENCIQSVKLLEKELQKKGKVEDWGACHVTYLPYAEQFRKVGA